MRGSRHLVKHRVSCSTVTVSQNRIVRVGVRGGRRWRRLGRVRESDVEPKSDAFRQHDGSRDHILQRPDVARRSYCWSRTASTWVSSHRDNSCRHRRSDSSTRPRASREVVVPPSRKASVSTSLNGTSVAESLSSSPRQPSRRRCDGCRIRPQLRQAPDRDGIWGGSRHQHQRQVLERYWQGTEDGDWPG
jgi:hypothetical protein